MLDNAHQVIKQILASLFIAEEGRLERVKEGLVQTNANLYPQTPHDGFNFGGQVYDRAGLPRGQRTRVRLDPTLYKEMDQFIRDKGQIEADRKLIAQILVPLLLPCSTAQEMYDALPACLADSLTEFRGLRRQAVEAWTLRDNPRLLAQYEKILPRIEFYSIARLMY